MFGTKAFNVSYRHRKPLSLSISELQQQQPPKKEAPTSHQKDAMINLDTPKVARISPRGLPLSFYMPTTTSTVVTHANNAIMTTKSVAATSSKDEPCWYIQSDPNLTSSTNSMDSSQDLSPDLSNSDDSAQDDNDHKPKECSLSAIDEQKERKQEKDATIAIQHTESFGSDDDDYSVASSKADSEYSTALRSKLPTVFSPTALNKGEQYNTMRNATFQYNNEESDDDDETVATSASIDTAAAIPVTEEEAAVVSVVIAPKESTAVVPVAVATIAAAARSCRVGVISKARRSKAIRSFHNTKKSNETNGVKKSNYVVAVTKKQSSATSTTTTVVQPRRATARDRLRRNKNQSKNASSVVPPEEPSALEQKQQTSNLQHQYYTSAASANKQPVLHQKDKASLSQTRKEQYNDKWKEVMMMKVMKNQHRIKQQMQMQQQQQQQQQQLQPESTEEDDPVEGNDIGNFLMDSEPSNEEQETEFLADPTPSTIKGIDEKKFVGGLHLPKLVLRSFRTEPEMQQNSSCLIDEATLISSAPAATTDEDESYGPDGGTSWNYDGSSECDYESEVAFSEVAFSEVEF